MASSSTDQSAMMKEILDSVKGLQMNQIQLASNVDAINGRLNVLAGVKEVRDIASDDSKASDLMLEEPEPASAFDKHQLQGDSSVPESPSLPATHVDQVGEIPAGPVSVVQKQQGVTSRIILT